MQTCQNKQSQFTKNTENFVNKNFGLQGYFFDKG